MITVMEPTNHPYNTFNFCRASLRMFGIVMYHLNALSQNSEGLSDFLSMILRIARAPFSFWSTLSLWSRINVGNILTSWYDPDRKIWLLLLPLFIATVIFQIVKLKKTSTPPTMNSRRKNCFEKQFWCWWSAMLSSKEIRRTSWNFGCLLDYMKYEIKIAKSKSVEANNLHCPKLWSPRFVILFPKN